MLLTLVNEMQEFVENDAIKLDCVYRVIFLCSARAECCLFAVWFSFSNCCLYCV